MAAKGTSTPGMFLDVDNMSFDDFFSEHKKPIEGRTQKEEKIYQKYKKIITQKRENLNIDMQKIDDGQQLRIITSNAINAIVAIDLIMSHSTINEVFICIYRMNLKAVEFIRSNIYNTGIKCTILLSSFFRENKRYERWFEQLAALDSEQFRVKTGCLHAKIFACRTHDNKHYVFEGSGNLSDNARIEQYIFEKNEAVYNFHKKWMSEY